MTKKNFRALIRWLHIYLSMFGFMTLLFFAVTGLTLNHPGWAEGKQQVKILTGKIDPAWLTRGDSTVVAREEIIEQIRNTHEIKAKLSDFRADDYEYSVSFSGPGYSADAFIDRTTGSYEMTVVSAGFIAAMNDLHKGSNTGKSWTRVIDISAILMIVVSVTGIIMIFFLSKRKLPGLVVALTGALIFIILCLV